MRAKQINNISIKHYLPCYCYGLSPTEEVSIDCISYSISWKRICCHYILIKYKQTLEVSKEEAKQEGFLLEVLSLDLSIIIIHSLIPQQLCYCAISE